MASVRIVFGTEKQRCRGCPCVFFLRHGKSSTVGIVVVVVLLLCHNNLQVFFLRHTRSVIQQHIYIYIFSTFLFFDGRTVYIYGCSLLQHREREKKTPNPNHTHTPKTNNDLRNTKIHTHPPYPHFCQPIRNPGRVNTHKTKTKNQKSLAHSLFIQ